MWFPEDLEDSPFTLMNEMKRLFSKDLLSSLASMPLQLYKIQIPFVYRLVPSTYLSFTAKRPTIAKPKIGPT